MHTNFLSVHQSFSVEWVCIAIIMTMTVARMGADGFSMRRYFFIVKDEGPVATASYQEAQILRATRISSALILAMTNKWTDNSVSLVLFLRVLIWFTYSKATQRELATVVKIAPELVSILFLLFVIIFFYALVGGGHVFREKRRYRSIFEYNRSNVDAVDMRYNCKLSRCYDASLQ